MSETLNAPWIADYLINIAETYGCKLSSIPIHVKPGKKVQLLQVSGEQQRCSYDLSNIDWLSSSLSENSQTMTVSGPGSLTSISGYLYVSRDMHLKNTIKSGSYCLFLSRNMNQHDLAKENGLRSSVVPSLQLGPSSPFSSAYLLEP